MTRAFLPSAALAAALAVDCLCAAATHANTPDSQAAVVQPSDAILPDPNIRIGILPNGLRYAIMRNSTPKGAVSLRLGVAVGTFAENAGEFGAAHFLEHMAFSNGRNQRETGPERAFSDAGITFGRDVNAFTNLFSTRYQLDLPAATDSSLNLAFKWLRGVADGTSFATDAVDRERDVILAERASRLTPQFLAAQEAEAFQMPGLRSARRETIGTVSELRAIRPDVLETFYRRWYRPPNAVFVAVGDADPDVLERRIRSAFSSWKSAGAMPPMPAFGSPDTTRGLDVLAFGNPLLPPSVAACRVHKPEPRGPDSVVRLRRSVLSQIWVSVLDRRLAALTKSRNAPYLAADALNSEEQREAGQTCVTAIPVDGAWDQALRAEGGEVTELLAKGPSEDEIDAAIAAIRSSYRGVLMTAGTRKSNDIAERILDAQLDGDVVASPAEDFRAFDVAVENVTPADVRDAFARDWSGAGPFIVLTEPHSVDTAAVRSAWTASLSASTVVSPSGTGPAWAYENFGPVGEPIKREAFEDPQFVRLTFANGAKLNFKHTEFEQRMTYVRVAYGAGRREIANRDLIAAKLGAEIFPLGGLGKHDFDDIGQIFAQQSWGAKLAVRDDVFAFDGSVTTGGLKTQLQILAAYVSDPGFRSTIDARLPTLIDLYYRDARSDPQNVLAFALADAIAPGGPRSLPSKESLDSLRMRDFERLLKPALAEAPLEVTIVGDVDEATASELVGETFGALPPRSTRSRERPDTQFLRFPAGTLPTIRTTHEGADSIAIVGAVWPLYVAVPERRREEVALMLLSQIFDTELRDHVRQQLGKAYSPAVALVTPDHGDQGYMQAEVETSPADVKIVLAETEQIASGFARGNISEAMLQAARMPALARLSQRATSNDAWLSALSQSARTADGLDEMKNLPLVVRSVTLDEVRKAAATWLARMPLTIVAMPTGQATPMASVNH